MRNRSVQDTARCGAVPLQHSKTTLNCCSDQPVCMYHCCAPALAHPSRSTAYRAASPRRICATICAVSFEPVAHYASHVRGRAQFARSVSRQTRSVHARSDFFVLCVIFLRDNYAAREGEVEVCAYLSHLQSPGANVKNRTNVKGAYMCMCLRCCWGFSV